MHSLLSRSCRVLVATAAVLSIAAAAWAKDRAQDTAALRPKVVWRARVGAGYSGVAVSDDKAITMFEDGEQFIAAFDAATGKELWRRRIAAAYPGRDGSWNGPISTPVVHEDLVVALEPWGRLFALDTTNGEPVWSVHLSYDLGAPRPAYGFGSSPLVVDSTLVVHGGEAGGTVIGFDVETGDLRWSVGDEPVVAPSPVDLTLAGKRMVVAAGAEHVFGIDAGTGEVIWEYSHGGTGNRGQGSLVPVGLDGDRIFLAHDDDSSQVIGLHAGFEGTTVGQVWRDRTIRNSYNVAVHHEGFLYAYSSRVLVCVDATTGELQWRTRAPGDGFITLVDDTMVILTKNGSLHVARVAPEGYEELASATIFDELTWTRATVAHGDVFARSFGEMVRVDLHGDGAAPKATGASPHVARSLDSGDGEFGRFIRTVERADNPAPLIDAFFAAHPQLPLIEGNDLVHFVYRGDDQVMAIAGDHIGARQEALMVRVGTTDLFYFTARIQPNARISYVFIRETEVIRDPHNQLGSETLIYNADREFTTTGESLAVSELRMPKWELPQHLREPDAATRGSLDTLVVSSVPFGEVAFHVYLPNGYADSDERYPVVYYHGPTPPELSAVPRSLDNLISDGDLRPVIAVFSEASLPPIPAYTDFWADELVPAIDARYRTITDAEGRVAVGGDLATLHSVFLAFERPEMTSGLGLHSIAFLDSDWDALGPILRTAAKRPLRIYMDWGTYSMHNPQEGWDLRAESVRYWKEFERLGFTLAGGEAPDSDGWASWRNRADVMLRALLPDEE